MKILLRLLAIFFLFANSSLHAQQVYHMQGKILEAKELAKDLYSETEKTLRQLDSLYKEVDPSLSAKEALEYQLELQLLRGKIYDECFEQEQALKTLLVIPDQAEAHQLHSITARAYLLLIAVKQKSNDLAGSEEYMNLAYDHIQKYHFDDLYSTYYYHKASWHRLKNEYDATVESAQKALSWAEKYNNEENIALANTMLGVGYGGKEEFQKAIAQYHKVIPYYRKTNNLTFLAMMYRNISRMYFRTGDNDRSFTYIDSAYAYYDEMSYFYKEYLPLMRLDLHAEIGQWDSAFHYLKDFHTLTMNNLVKRESSKLKGITEEYENKKNEAVIKEKEQQVFFITTLLAVIGLGGVLLLRKNRQINKQNRIINTQLGELTKTLEQKQVLLSELQHRVKNNLQHVISILEIQKESVDFNNIDELIRGNQNRIHSMALLHKKLNVSDSVDDIDLKRYVTELAELVKESYDNDKRKITLQINCEPEIISIEKALPIGLIVTELVSNSMKHAFKKHSTGTIHIEITQDEDLIKFFYADNGDGFDFHKKSDKGLGQEIIKGLIDQLDGRVETRAHQGFELSMRFKV